MLHPSPTREELVYRLVLVSPDSRCVLAQHDGPGISLPRVSIPKWTRPAAEIQKTISIEWGLSIIVLDFLKDAENRPSCVVAQLLLPQHLERLKFVAFDRFPASELTDSGRATVEAICASDAGDRGSFSRIGWIDEAMEWISEEAGREVQFTGEIEQHNASGTFALIRFATQGGPAYWLKATGEPNLHEFDITAMLAAICPKYLPPLVAMRRDWNAWVMEDAGDSLDQQVSVPVLERAIVSMAGLQKKTVGYTEQLLGSGATDQRIAVLRGHVDEIISYLEEAMEQQTSTKVPRLRVSRLREIGTMLKDACGAMEELGIPETIIHNDINRGNILVRDNACVFTDWCEAYTGNPFVTFQHLMLLLPSNGDHAEADHFKLMHAYKQCWLDSLVPWQIDQAFALIPLLAVASYFYGRGGWLRSARRYDPHMQSYARSLARHMDRAAQIPSLMEALCH